LTRLTQSDVMLRELEPEDLHWLDEASDEEVEQLLAALCSSELPPVDARDLASVLRHLVYRLQPWMKQERRRLDPNTIPLVRALYGVLGPKYPARCYLLQMLSSSAAVDDLAELADLLAEDPPEDASAAMLALGPLFQHTDYDVTALFPRLLDAIAHQAVAASVIDLANFLTRRESQRPHPAAPRKQELMALLSGIVQRLGQIEEDPDNFAESREQLMQQIDDSVALAVALCDALALIGDKEAIGKLYQAFEIKHRRLHTEAAAALARFGEEEGEKALVALAAEPVARLRVLAYADELGFADKIDDQYRTATAEAEAELALWLAQPAQMGIPPTQLELVDSQTQYWPGFDDPVESFLFRFVYRVGEGEYSNIGIAGPLTHAFAADLQDLPPDDIYAAFAGWHVQHEDIYERDFEDLIEAQRVEVSKLERRLRDDRFDAIQPVKFGMFLGDRVLVARANREGHAGIAVTDGHDSLWFAHRHPERPITAAEAICIYRGRRLLRTFN
jgi:hypothetical protein